MQIIANNKNKVFNCSWQPDRFAAAGIRLRSKCANDHRYILYYIFIYLISL